MTRKIYRNSYCEKELAKIKSDLDQLRKHNQDHFTLAALCQMESASNKLSEAINTMQLSSKYIEEVKY